MQTFVCINNLPKALSLVDEAHGAFPNSGDVRTSLRFVLLSHICRRSATHYQQEHKTGLYVLIFFEFDVSLFFPKTSKFPRGAFLSYVVNLSELIIASHSCPFCVPVSAACVWQSCEGNESRFRFMNTIVWSTLALCFLYS